MPSKTALLVSIVLALIAATMLAQEPGQGAIVIRDTERDGPAPIYVHEQGDAIKAQAAQGDFVAGYNNLGIIAHSYAFQQSNGRVHVVYFANNKRSGFLKMAWMDPADLRMFDYDCSCGLQAFHGLKMEACSPFAPIGILRFRWNACFEKARDDVMAQLQPHGGDRPAKAASAETEDDPADKPLSMDAITAATGGSQDEKPDKKQKSVEPHASKQKDLTNADIISLVKAELGDKVIIDKIRASSGEKLDTSTEALIRLKKAGVSRAVIDAIVKQTSN